MTREQTISVQTVDKAIEIAKRYSTRGSSIRFKNHLNSQGHYSTVDPVDIANMENELHGLYLYLCRFSHQLVNHKTFEISQYGKQFKITVEMT